MPNRPTIQWGTPLAVERVFPCQICSKSFKSESYLRTHIRTHLKESPLICSDCDKVFSYTELLNNQFRIYDSTSILQRPLDSLLGEAIYYKCNICDKEFTGMDYLNTHMRTHNQKKRYMCLDCDMIFNNQMYSRSPSVMSSKHGNFPTPVMKEVGHHYKCKECGIEYNTLSYLKTHMRAHEAEAHYKCFDCAKVFSHAEFLQDQLGGPISNYQKGYQYSEVDDYIHNKYVGQGEGYEHGIDKYDETNTHEPYRCSHCEKALLQREHLQRRKKESESITPSPQIKKFSPRPLLGNTLNYTCTVCGMEYTSSYYLKTHMRAHESETQYKCLDCEKVFTRAELLQDQLGGPISNYQKSHQYSELTEYMYNKYAGQGEENTIDKSTEINSPEAYRCSRCEKLRHQKELSKRRNKESDCTAPGVESVLCTPTLSKGIALYYTCTVCGMEYTSSYYLKTHMRAHESETQYKCLDCEKVFTRAELLQDQLGGPISNYHKSHQYSGLAEYMYNKYASKGEENAIDKSAEINSPEAYRCSRCEKVRNQKEHSKRHNKEFDCTIPGVENAISTPTLSKGIALYYTCTVCGMEYTSSYYLKTHMRAHEAETKYICLDCDKLFTYAEIAQDQLGGSISNYQKGRRYCNIEEYIHNKYVGQGEGLENQRGKSPEMKTPDPYRCSQCEKVLHQRVRLQRRNKESYFTKLEDRQSSPTLSKGSATYYKCTICGMEYTSSYYLQTHMRAHKSERSYKCLDCTKHFTHAEFLKDQLGGPISNYQKGLKYTELDEYIHNKYGGQGEKNKKGIDNTPEPYRCSPCERALHQRVSTQRLQKEYNGTKSGPEYKQYIPAFTKGNVKYYKCTICDVECTSPTYLSTHIRYHVSDKPAKCSGCDRVFRNTNILERHLRVYGGLKHGNGMLSSYPLRNNIKYTIGGYDKRKNDNNCRNKSVKPRTMAETREIHSLSPIKLNLNQYIKNKVQSECRNDTKENSSTHMRTHETEKSHTCKYCNEVFSKVMTLEKHMQDYGVLGHPKKCSVQHKTISPYFKCEECYKEYTSLSYLNTHRRSHPALTIPTPMSIQQRYSKTPKVKAL